MIFVRTRSSGPAQIVIGCLVLVFAILFFSLSLAAQVASGLDSTESTTAFPSDATTDQIFADSTYQRWRMNNHNRGAQLVAAWPCTSAGCMTFADTNTVNANVYPEKALNHPGTAGNVLLTVTSPNNAPSWSAWTVPSTVCGNGLSLVSNGTSFVCSQTIFPLVARLASDTAGYTSTTMTNLTGVSFSVAANTTYNVTCDIFYQVSAITGGLALTFTGPASPTNVIFGGYEGKGSNNSSYNSVATAFAGVLFNQAASSATTNLAVHISGTIENGANAGTLQLQYANFASSAGSLTIKRGSWCQLF